METPSRPSRLVVLGSDVSTSLSPTFQRAALAAAGIPLSYEAVSVSAEDLPAAIEEIRRTGVAGNVTRPHKASFHDACDVLTPTARRVGAVNTFWVTDGRLYGDNTDVEGFDLSARELLNHQTKDIVALVLGAGGAAAAVLAAVERWPSARAIIVSRSSAKASRLAERYAGSATVESDAVAAAERAGLIVNATPIGQHDDSMPLDPSVIGRGTAVLDLVYRRGETAWIRALRANGNAARDGMTMLLEQGALSFRRWFGIEPDRAVMRASLE
ncbi:MAG TPA: shikimate dehydrogenase [Gemmatimonadaceae bacterium]|nr:shikimate dehydrogenase [Gemmatimonadaceae bacterium]